MRSIYDFSRDEILNNLYIGLRQHGGELLGKTSELIFDDDIEQYVYIRVYKEGDEIGTIKEIDDILDHFDISVDMAIKSAMINSKKETKVVSMAEVLGFKEEHGDPMMLVVTNTYSYLGAGNLMASWEDISTKLRNKGYKRVVLIPSSIHEWIITDVSNDDASPMVSDVNKSVVEKSEWLSDKSYEVIL